MSNALGGLFATPEKEPSRMSAIFAALGGAGAGFRGQGQQYVQGLRDRQENLSQERTQAMIQDALAVDDMLATSRVEPAMQFMNERLNMIRELGGDPSDTAEVMQLVHQGRVGEARELIGGFLGQAEAMGLYERPRPEMINASHLNEAGQAVFQSLDGTTFAQEVAGARQPDQRPTDAFRTIHDRAIAAGLEPGTQEYQQFMADGGRAQADPVRTQKIGSLAPQLAEQFGVDPAQAETMATNVVDGILRYEVTQHGRVLEINASTGEVNELPIRGSGDARQAVGSIQEMSPTMGNEAISLYGMSENISGPGNTARAFGAKVSSMFGMEAFPDTVTSRQVAEGAMQGLVRSLSINDRYPVREIERIREDMAKISPRLFSGGPEVRAQMRGLHILLDRNLDMARRDSSNPEMPTDIRAGAARAANDISNFLDLMGYVDADILSTPDKVTSTPLSSLEQFVSSASDAELARLSPEVEEAIYQRLSRARNP